MIICRNQSNRVPHPQRHKLNVQMSIHHENSFRMIKTQYGLYEFNLSGYLFYDLKFFICHLVLLKYIQNCIATFTLNMTLDQSITYTCSIFVSQLVVKFNKTAAAPTATK